ncbi:MAG TPA: YggS family pyridoxal phosphate-dependent enzyme [Vicinamibacterales bacterium]|nr:YggS family pyridoxal phosphate-dependent enzyme [Vicinamibacterales bacterium]
MPAGSEIASNLTMARAVLARAAARVARDAASIRLIAVSKTFPADAVREAAAHGQRAFGENRVQEGLDKAEVLADLTLEWHLIGHLQSNKVKRAAAVFPWIHSVDSRALLDRLDRAAHDAGTAPNILLQVDLAGEDSKHGVPPEQVGALAAAAADARAVRLRGLMILPPFPGTPEDSRPWFRRLRELRDTLVSAGIAAPLLAALSMGMSHDFEVAIEEGATMVRIGTAIFGRRSPPATA